jgi:periplasmic protein TonB
MSRQGARIAWFIALSAAIHAAVLLVGNRPDTRIAPAGQTVHVSMNYRADAAGPPAPAVNPAGRERTSRDQPHVTTNRPSPVRAARKELSRRHDHTQQETTATQPVTTRQAENTPAREQSSPAAAGMETARQTAREQLHNSILRLVSSRFNYPLLARRKGWQGVVKLQVHIESDGRISRLHVEQTSGYPVLDRAALQSLQLASVPDAEKWMQGQAIDIIIPVEYRLVGG